MNIERYKSYYEKIGRKYFEQNNNIFYVYNKMIVPVGPITKKYNKLDYKELFNEFPNAVMIRTTSGIEKTEKNDWYAVICDDFKSLEEMNSKIRYQVKKGLKSCTVKKISIEFLAEHGYEVYISAFKSYKHTTIPNTSKGKFYNDIMLGKGFDDLIEYWGCFSEDKLIAYAINHIYGKEEVEYSVIKINPTYLKKYPIYALIYTMNEYYLKENEFKYVNDGFRSISHDTNIQDFLISKFNFRKQEVSIKIKYRWYLDLIIRYTFAFRNILRRIDRRINAIYTMEEIIRMKNYNN